MSKPTHVLLHPLTGLRAIAALWVVLVHVEMAHPVNAPYWADLLLGSFGTLPVVFFFMLSGFILTVVYAGRVKGSRFCKRGLKDYSWARFARIMPLYFVSLVPALLILAIRWNARGALPSLEAMGIGTKFFEMQGSTLDYLLRINIPAWTLIAEAVFYALFPFFLRRILEVKGERIWRWIGGYLALYLGVQGALTAFFMANSTWFGSFAHGVSHFSPPVFIPVFLVGMLLGVVYLRGMIPNWIQQRSGRIYISLGVCILGTSMIQAPLLPVSLISAFIAPLFCLTILAGSVKGNKTNKVLSSPVFQSLGMASYAIYITHWPVRDMVQPVFAAMGLSDMWVGWLTVAVSILVGYIAHLWVEKPLHRKILEWQKRKQQLRNTGEAVV